jgi:hypothetical protein
LTLLLLGKTKSERELLEIAEEFGSEIGVPQFLELYKQATDEPHSFLMIDLHPKPEHPRTLQNSSSPEGFWTATEDFLWLSVKAWLKPSNRQ